MPSRDQFTESNAIQLLVSLLVGHATMLQADHTYVCLKKATIHSYWGTYMLLETFVHVFSYIYV